MAQPQQHVICMGLFLGLVLSDKKWVNTAKEICMRKSPHPGQLLTQCLFNLIRNLKINSADLTPPGMQNTTDSMQPNYNPRHNNL